MSERVVVDAPGAERLRPRQRIVTRCSDRSGVQVKQHLYAAARVLLERVELLDKRKSFADSRRRRMTGIFDHDGSSLRPRVIAEVRAHEAAVIGPLIERVRGAVHANEPATIADEIEQRCLLRR